MGIFDDLTRIIIAPVRVATDLAEIVTKPVADAAEFIADEVEEITDDLKK